MKKEWQLVLGAASFLVVVFVVYWFWSYEDAGSVMLLFSGCAYALLAGFFALQWLRRKRIPRPEDSPDANQEDGAGEVSFFPTNSIWPAGMGLGAIFAGIGLIWGLWYLIIGLILLIGSVIGFVTESEADAEAIDEVHEAMAREQAAAEAGQAHAAHVEHTDA